MKKNKQGVKEWLRLIIENINTPKSVKKEAQKKLDKLNK